MSSIVFIEMQNSIFEFICVITQNFKACAESIGCEYFNVIQNIIKKYILHNQENGLSSRKNA